MKAMQLVTLFMIFFGTQARSQDSKPETDKKGFAVVELFTSEGCSSCPPADVLMGKIQEQYQNDNVYVLSYHVDYWDHQGWKDIFSNPDYTKRQQQYAKWLDLQTIYTPQAVINGKDQLVGSRASDLDIAIKKALIASAPIKLSLNALQVDDKLEIGYETNSFSKSNLLNVAIIQKSAQIQVKRGENGGRVLFHYQIVRNFRSMVPSESGKGSLKMEMPKNFNLLDFEVIGFIQNTASGTILGATKARF